MLKQISIKLFIGILFLWSAISWFNHLENKKIVAEILNLKEVPLTVSNTECESWGFTDVLTTCYIEISPQEFPLLFKGYTYQKLDVSENSHNVSNRPKLGREFHVSKQFLVYPKEFIHGGAVNIYANAEMSKAILDLYIE